MLCRVIADYEAPTISVTVPAATAKQYGNTSIVVSSQPDTAEVVLADRTALMDLTLTAAPLQPAVPGKHPTALVQPCVWASESCSSSLSSTDQARVLRKQTRQNFAAAHLMQPEERSSWCVGKQHTKQRVRVLLTTLLLFTLLQGSLSSRTSL